MPSPKTVAWSQLKVGLMALVALALLATLIFYMTGSKSLFQSEATVYTYMEAAPGLAKGSPVRFNGFVVGNVETLELIKNAPPGRAVRVTMMIDDRYLGDIPPDSRATIGAESLLGSKLVDIARGVSRAALRPGGELASTATPEIDDIVKEGVTTLQGAQIILKRLDNVVAAVESGDGTIGKLLKDEGLYRRVDNIAAGVEKVTVAMNSGKGSLGKFIYDDALYQDVRNSITKVDGVVDGLQRGEGTLGKLLKDPALHDDVRKTIEEMRTLVADLNAGKGTAGALLKDPKLAQQMSQLLTKLDNTISMVNAGQGTIGQLMVNPQVYDNINGLTTEMKGLMQDFRANPKKFLRIKLSLF